VKDRQIHALLRLSGLGVSCNHSIGFVAFEAAAGGGIVCAMEVVKSICKIVVVVVIANTVIAIAAEEIK